MSTTTASFPVCTVEDVGGFVYDTTVRVLFAEAGGITDPNQVTQEEIDYATDTTDMYCLVGINGWEVIGDVIVDPPWGLFDSQRIGGLRMRSTVNTLVYAADRFGNDIRELLTRGIRGWILILPSGLIPGTLMNVYPVWVTSVMDYQRLRNNGAQVEVRFAITARPSVDVRVPDPAAGGVTWDGSSVMWNGQQVTWTP